MVKYRQKYETLYEMVCLCKDTQYISSLVCKLHVAHYGTTDLLKILLKNKLIEVVDDKMSHYRGNGNATIYYRTTNKGLKFIQLFETLKEEYLNEQ